MRAAKTCLIVFAAIMGASTATARNYAIRFDFEDNHLDCDSGPDMIKKMFKPFVWRSAGWENGGLYQNLTGQKIMAISIKVTHPRTSDNPNGDLLAITSEPEDTLFDTIYVKYDPTQVIFSSSKKPIETSQTIWIKATQSSAQELKDCNNNSEPICPLSGTLFTTSQKPPEGEKWTQLKKPSDENS